MKLLFVCAFPLASTKSQYALRVAWLTFRVRDPNAMRAAANWFDRSLQ